MTYEDRSNRVSRSTEIYGRDMNTESLNIEVELDLRSNMIHRRMTCRVEPTGVKCRFSRVDLDWNNRSGYGRGWAIHGL